MKSGMRSTGERAYAAATNALTFHRSGVLLSLRAMKSKRISPLLFAFHENMILTLPCRAIRMTPTRMRWRG